MAHTVQDRIDLWQEMEKRRRVPRILLEGTFGLQNNPRTYRFVLPPEADEEEQQDDDTGLTEYERRIRRAVIDPYYERATDRAVSTLFNKPIQLRDDVPEPIRGEEDAQDGIWWNLDGRGNNGDEFFRMVAQESIQVSGMAGVLVDFPRVPDGATQAEVDDVAPYAVLYEAKHILPAERDYVDGRERIKKLRLQEDPHIEGRDKHRQERVLIAPEPGAEGRFVRYEIWQEVAPGGDEWIDEDDSSSYVVVEDGVMAPQTEIPFVVYYTGRQGFFHAHPPFSQLGYLNLNHTRHYNDIGEDLRISAGATLFRTIADESELKQRAIGARRLLYGKIGDTGQQPSAQWLERSGSAASVYSEFIRNLEARMTALGNEVHMRRTPGNETATGKAIDTAEAKTETEAWSMALKDVIENVLGYFAVYLGASSGGGVIVSPPPRFSDRDLETVKGLLEARREGLLLSEEDTRMVYEVMREVYRLPDDWSPAEAAERSTQQGPLVPGGLETVRDAMSREQFTVGDTAMPEPDEGE